MCIRDGGDDPPTMTTSLNFCNLKSNKMNESTKLMYYTDFYGECTEWEQWKGKGVLATLELYVQP